MSETANEILPLSKRDRERATLALEILESELALLEEAIKALRLLDVRRARHRLAYETGLTIMRNHEAAEDAEVRERLQPEVAERPKPNIVIVPVSVPRPPESGQQND